MFEHRSKPLLSRGIYLRRQAKHALFAAALIALSLGRGAVGNRLLERQPWVDAIYSASMILTGMGPAIEVKTDAGKLFASAYALFSGVIFLTAVSVAMAPALHRFLHALHVEEEEDG